MRYSVARGSRLQESNGVKGATPTALPVLVDCAYIDSAKPFRCSTSSALMSGAVLPKTYDRSGA